MNAYKHEQERKREGDKDAHRHALHCIRAKLTNGSCFSCFSFFQVHDLGRNLGVPAELEMDVPVPLLFDFSRLCRVILAGESWRDRPSQITCNGQLRISHLISLCLYFCLSLSRAYSLLLCSLFLSPSFVFTLTFMRSTQPSHQFRLLSQMREEGMSGVAERAAPSLFRIIISFLAIPAE